MRQGLRVVPRYRRVSGSISSAYSLKGREGQVLHRRARSPRTRVAAGEGLDEPERARQECALDAGEAVASWRVAVAVDGAPNTCRGAVRLRRMSRVCRGPATTGGKRDRSRASRRRWSRGTVSSIPALQRGRPSDADAVLCRVLSIVRGMTRRGTRGGTERVMTFLLGFWQCLARWGSLLLPRVCAWSRSTSGVSSTDSDACGLSLWAQALPSWCRSSTASRR